MTTAKTAATTSTAPADAKTTPYFATRDFTDAGTGRSFEKADELTGIDAGTLRNYRAAGLASTTRPATAAAA